MRERGRMRPGSEEGHGRLMEGAEREREKER